MKIPRMKIPRMKIPRMKIPRMKIPRMKIHRITKKEKTPRIVNKSDYSQKWKIPRNIKKQ